MADTPYAHLHVHTEYSMLDGAARLKDMFKEVERQRHDARGDDRPRQHVRRGRVPPAGQGQRHHPGHRHRGLRRARAPGQQASRILWGQPHQKKRRRLRPRRLPAQDHLGAQQRGPAQPVQALQPLLRGGLAGQVAADGQGDPRRARRRPDGLHRLPVRRAADQAAARPRGRGAAGGRRVPGHLRQGELLPRADGPRPDIESRVRDGLIEIGGSWTSRRSSPTTPTTQGVRRHGARPAAVHPDRQDPGRRGPVPVRRQRLLHQVRRTRCTRSTPPTSGRKAAGTASS